MNKKERNQLLCDCRQATNYDIWWDGDIYIVKDTGFRCKSIHDLAYYCEVYEQDDINEEDEHEAFTEYMRERN